MCLNSLLTENENIESHCIEDVWQLSTDMDTVLINLHIQ